MDLKLEISAEQYAALDSGASRVAVIKTPAGAVQKGDALELTPPPDLFNGAPLHFSAFRVTAGTKDNGILPGFSVVELAGIDLLLEARAAAAAEK